MRHKLKQWALGTAAMAAVGTASVAQAAIISGSFDYTATFAVSSPFTSISGTVTYSFDNAAGFTSSTTGITITGIPTALTTSGTGMSYFPSSPILQDVLAVGDLLNGPSGISSGSSDWVLLLSGVSTNPTVAGFSYSVANGGPQTYGALSVSLTPTVSVPEPASLSLVALGGLGLIAAPRARRRA